MNEYLNEKCQCCRKKPIRSVAKCELCGKLVCFRHRKIATLAYSIYQSSDSVRVGIPLCTDCSIMKHPKWLKDDINKIINKLVKYERDKRGVRNE